MLFLQRTSSRLLRRHFSAAATASTNNHNLVIPVELVSDTL